MPNGLETNIFEGCLLIDFHCFFHSGNFFILHFTTWCCTILVHFYIIFPLTVQAWQYDVLHNQSSCLNKFKYTEEKSECAYPKNTFIKKSPRSFELGHLNFNKFQHIKKKKKKTNELQDWVKYFLSSVSAMTPFNFRMYKWLGKGSK